MDLARLESKEIHRQAFSQKLPDYSSFFSFFHIHIPFGFNYNKANIFIYSTYERRINMHRRFVASLIAFLLFLSLLPSASSQQENKELKMYFFNQNMHVNSSTIHGDATLICFPNGKTMLVDAGTTSFSITLVKWLEKLGITHIDYFVATHLHQDHVGGFKNLTVKKTLTIDQVLSSGLGSTYVGADRTFHQALKRQKKTETFVRAGDTLDFDEVQIEFLWPLPETEDLPIEIALEERPNLNLEAIVFKLTYKDFSILMTGDIHTPSEEKILALYPVDKLRCTVLKAAHHGLYTSNSPAFVAAVDPQAVIAMTQDSYYYEGLDEITLEKGLPLYRTNVNGDIFLTTNGNTMTIQCDTSTVTYDLSQK